MDVRIAFIQKMLADKYLKLYKINTLKNTSDILTKAVPAKLLHSHLMTLRVFMPTAGERATSRGTKEYREIEDQKRATWCSSGHFKHVVRMMINQGLGASEQDISIQDVWRFVLEMH